MNTNINSLCWRSIIYLFCMPKLSVITIRAEVNKMSTLQKQHYLSHNYLTKRVNCSIFANEVCLWQVYQMVYEFLPVFYIFGGKIHVLWSKTGKNTCPNAITCMLRHGICIKIIVQTFLLLPHISHVFAYRKKTFFHIFFYFLYFPHIFKYRYVNTPRLPLDLTSILSTSIFIKYILFYAKYLVLYTYN